MNVEVLSAILSNPAAIPFESAETKLSRYVFSRFDRGLLMLMSIEPAFCHPFICISILAFARVQDVLHKPLWHQLLFFLERQKSHLREPAPIYFRPSSRD
jgi:hypothetical protein